MKQSLAVLRSWFGRSRGPHDVTDATTKSTRGLPDQTSVGIAEHRSAGFHDNVFERATLLWNVGAWEALISISVEEIRNSPNRAKLALLIASAYIQTDRPSDASRLLQLAAEWGCDPRSVSEVLIGGAHHNLGRASFLLGKGDEEQEHAQRATSIAWSDSRGQEKVVAARVQANRDEFELAGLGRRTNTNAHAAIGHQQHDASRQAPSASPSSAVASIAPELGRLRVELTRAINAACANSVKQLEAFIGIQHYLATGEVTNEMHGWPISPDFGMHLIRMIESTQYDLIIEFGSGVSTCLMGRALQNTRRRTGKAAKYIAFEHLEAYYQDTQHKLESAGVEPSTVQLELCGLEQYAGPDGANYDFYACARALKSIARVSIDARILVVVDGPPGATGPHARYPALPVVLAEFPGVDIDVVLDDSDRKEEREVVQLWCRHLGAVHLPYYMDELKFEKGACLLAIRPERPLE